MSGRRCGGPFERGLRTRGSARAAAEPYEWRQRFGGARKGPVSAGASSPIALGAAAAVVVLGGVWYVATLRAQNAMLREQIAGYERAALAQERGAERATAESRPASRGSASSDSRPQRMLSDEQREAMRSTLSAEPGRRVWFVRQPNDPEAESFQRELEAVFQESGWEIAGSSEASYRIKAGLFMYMADAEPADHVWTALNGLRATGLEPFAGTGYRAYYEKKKAEDPSFRGNELAPEQDFVIVVGPNPDSAT